MLIISFRIILSIDFKPFEYSVNIIILGYEFLNVTHDQPHRGKPFQCTECDCNLIMDRIYEHKKVICLICSECDYNINALDPLVAGTNSSSTKISLTL